MRISKNTYDAIKGDYLNIPKGQAPNRYLKYPSSVNGAKYYAENDAKNDGSIFYPGAGENVDSNDDHSGSTIFETIPNLNDNIPKTYMEIDKSTGKEATDATSSDSIRYLNGTTNTKDSKSTSFLGKRDSNIPKQSVSTALSNSANGKYVFTRSLINNGDDPEINLGGDTSISDINTAVNTALSNSARGSITGKSSTETTDANAVSAFGTDLTNIYTTTDSLGNSSNYSKITSSVGSQDTNSEDISLSDSITSTLKDTALDALSAQTGITNKTISSISSLINSSDVNISNLGASLAYLDSWKSSNYKSLHTWDWVETSYLNPSANVANTMSNDLRGTLGNSSAIDTTSVKSTLSTVASSLLGKSTTNTIASLFGVDSDWDATSSELTNLNSTTKDTIYTTKPGMSIKSKASVIEDITGNNSQYFVSSGKERNIDSAVSSIRSKEVENSLSSAGRNFMKETSSDISIKKKLDTYTSNYYNTKSGKYINKKDESDFYGFNLSDRELRMIALLKQRNTYNKKLGYIYIRPTGASYNSFTENTDSSASTMQIPFEFNPTISEGAVTANYASETLLGRLGKFNIYTGTDLSSLTLETTYIALTPDTIDTDLEVNSNKQYSTDAWQYYWTNNRIEQLELMFRSLVFPDVTNSDYLIKPPLIELHLCNNDGMDADTVGDLYKYPYVNGYVNDKAVNAIGGSAGTYLNVSVTLSGSEAIGRYKKYIVNSCQISPVSEDYINYPSLYGRKYNSSNALSMGQNAAWHVATGTSTTTTTNEDGTTTSNSSTCGYAGYSRKLGFKVTLSCTEVTENYLDLVPDFQAYYNAWSNKEALANDASKYADSYFGISSTGTNKYQSAEDIITGSIATVASSLANVENRLNELFGEAETLSKLYAKSLSKKNDTNYESDYTYKIGKLNFDSENYLSYNPANTYYWANKKFSESSDYVNVSKSSELTKKFLSESYLNQIKDKNYFLVKVLSKSNDSKNFVSLKNSNVDNKVFYADNSGTTTKELTNLSKNDILEVLSSSSGSKAVNILPLYDSSSTSVVDINNDDEKYIYSLNMIGNLENSFNIINNKIIELETQRIVTTDASTMMDNISEDITVDNQTTSDYFKGIMYNLDEIIGIGSGDTIIAESGYGLIQFNLNIYESWLNTYYNNKSQHDYTKILTFKDGTSFASIDYQDYDNILSSVDLVQDIENIKDSIISESSENLKTNYSCFKSNISIVKKAIENANSKRSSAKLKKIQMSYTTNGNTLSVNSLLSCIEENVEMATKILSDDTYSYSSKSSLNYKAIKSIYDAQNSQDDAILSALSKNRQSILDINGNIYGIDASKKDASVKIAYCDISKSSGVIIPTGTSLKNNAATLYSTIKSIISSDTLYAEYSAVTNLSKCLGTDYVDIKQNGNNILNYSASKTKYKILGITSIYNSMIDTYNSVVSQCKELADESGCSIAEADGADDEISKTTSSALFGKVEEGTYVDLVDQLDSVISTLIKYENIASSCVDAIKDNFLKDSIDDNFKNLAKVLTNATETSKIQTLKENLGSFSSYGIDNYKASINNISGETYYCYKSEDSNGDYDYSLKVNAFGEWANKKASSFSKAFTDNKSGAGSIPETYYNYLNSKELKNKLSVASSTEAVSNYSKLTT